ncbi:2824_t:CDS:2 [Funneliformis mosseae]|uniref:2824_t:CDS:1 n=1 Tax=Funneliformis mosseae TaxID=27381 RepID=A0A9N9GQU1_FUNMO|nr:2824_t:CDS:2 [Funneliformis mosseae]
MLMHRKYKRKQKRQVVKRNELSLHQNKDLIDKLSGSKFAKTEKLVKSSAMS